MYGCSIGSGSPLWWLETGFGVWVFVLLFLTWGLIVVALVLHVLYLVRKLFSDDLKVSRKGRRKK